MVCSFLKRKSLQTHYCCLPVFLNELPPQQASTDALRASIVSLMAEVLKSAMRFTHHTTQLELQRRDNMAVQKSTKAPRLV